MKDRRQAKILEIISHKDVETQQMLAQELLAAGFNSTQATISRDIRELNLVKELSINGNYRYISTTKENKTSNGDKLRKIFRESVNTVTYAQNLVILKTLPGLASAACSAIDNMEVPDFLGSIAGDDTAFLAMRDTAAAQRFSREIDNML